MAIREASYIDGKIVKREFVGNSTDTKPIEDVPVLSMFYEEDTGDVYYFNGTSWLPV